MIAPCVSALLWSFDYLIRAFLTIGGGSVTIVRVVVVQRAVRVHVALVVGVPRVGRTEPAVTRNTEPDRIAITLYFRTSPYRILSTL